MSVAPGFHPDARIEFVQTDLRLNARRPGLGDQFEAALYATVETITMWPMAGLAMKLAEAGIEVRSLGIREFPFRLVYLGEGGRHSLFLRWPIGPASPATGTAA